jgi:hypothetical protein
MSGDFNEKMETRDAEAMKPRPRRKRSLYLKGEEPGQTRVPIWHSELKKTRRQVLLEWPKTSEKVSPDQPARH